MHPPQQSPEYNGLADILHALCELGEAQEQVSIADIREHFGERSAGPFLLVPALLEISPLGAVPGVPTFIALVIIVFAAQILFGRKHLWLPAFVERRELPGPKLALAMHKLEPAAAWVDRYIKHRWRPLTRKPFRLGIAALCIALCVVVPLLEVVPFASSVPMTAIALFGLGLIGRDGVLVGAGLAISLGTVYLVYIALSQ